MATETDREIDDLARGRESCFANSSADELYLALDQDDCGFDGMVGGEADKEGPHLAMDGEYAPGGNEIRLCAVARRQEGSQAKCALQKLRIARIATHLIH
jgi:hypothetical protein